MSPTPTPADIQARADALTAAELTAIADRAGYLNDHLTAALCYVASGWERPFLWPDDRAALAASEHRHIRRAGARRLLAARLLSEGK